MEKQRKFHQTLPGRAAVVLAIGSTLFMIWANLSVGLIGGGPNPGNLMYIGVVAVVIIGALFSGFTSSGLERAMYATVLAFVLVVIIALFANMHEYPSSSVIEIIGVNAFFAAPFFLAGLLFRYAGKVSQQQMEKSKG